MNKEELAAIRERHDKSEDYPFQVREDRAALLAEVERLTRERDAFEQEATLSAMRIHRERAKVAEARLDKVRALRQGGVCWICVEVLDEALDGCDQ